VVLATQSIRQFPLHFPSSASPCVVTFQLDPTYFVALVIQLAKRMRPTVTCGLSERTVYFSTLTLKEHDFRKKGY